MAYESNCAMLYLSAPDMATIQKDISKEDLYEVPGDLSYGLEKEPHVTLLFGLEPTVPMFDVQAILRKHTFVRGKLINASLFKNDVYEVLKFDIDPESVKRLSAVNSDLCKLPYKSEFDYHPHCTIAYLKPGTGDLYTVLFQFAEVPFEALTACTAKRVAQRASSRLAHCNQ